VEKVVIGRRLQVETLGKYHLRGNRGGGTPPKERREIGTGKNIKGRKKKGGERWQDNR